VRIATAGAVLVMLFLSTTLGNAQEPSAEGAVTRAIGCVADSWNRHDMRAFGECFTADADFVNVTTQWWKGRTAIQKNHAFMHGTIDASDITDVTVPFRTHGMFKASTLTFTSIEVRFARPDVGIAHAAWRMSGDVRTPEPRNGLMTIVVTNDSGRWQIAAVQNTEVARIVK